MVPSLHCLGLYARSRGSLVHYWYAFATVRSGSLCSYITLANVCLLTIGHEKAFLYQDEVGDLDFEWIKKYGAAWRSKGCLGVRMRFSFYIFQNVYPDHYCTSAHMNSIGGSVDGRRPESDAICPPHIGIQVQEDNADPAAYQDDDRKGNALGAWYVDIDSLPSLFSRFLSSPGMR